MSGDFDDEHVERLRDPAEGTDSRDDRLAAVLRAAASADRPGALSGEDAAVAAFRAGLADRARGLHQAPRRRLALRGAFVAVFLVLVVAAATVAAARLTVLKPTHGPALPPPLTATHTTPATGLWFSDTRLGALGRHAVADR